MAKWILRNLGWLIPVFIAVFALSAALNGVWMLWIAFAVLATVLLAVLRVELQRIDKREAYRRWLYRRCMHCGYSLIGNVSGVCPECGKRAPHPPPPPRIPKR
jgi:hypothetical protein